MNHRLLVSAHFLGLLVLYLNILRVPEWHSVAFPQYGQVEAEMRMKEAIGDAIIDSRFTPVMIFADDIFVALGTLLRSHPQQQIVVSPAHIFDQNIELRYSFQVLIPPTDSKIPINHVLLPPDQFGDYLFCVAGDSTPIGQLINPDNPRDEGDSKFERADELLFTSLFDGRHLNSECVESMSTSFGKQINRAIPLEFIIGHGECGMAFLDANGKLYQLVAGSTLGPSTVRQARDEGIRVPKRADFFAVLQEIDLDTYMSVSAEGFYEPKPTLAKVP